MTDWFRTPPTALAMMRATRSLAPPALKGATKVMGLSGQAALAGAEESAAEQASSSPAAYRMGVRNI
ncbi:hypothetical protein [Achromobacter sp. DMS1]|uniref:hypothetical protein n=1 Tax=Achromobacter sp. DMS1 TaxID=1688405 RepID=UPI000AC9B5CE|nr:hypothetical protein [Achromobacter sp. DMS1]